jgi:hypothetical protein
MLLLLLPLHIDLLLLQTLLLNGRVLALGITPIYYNM